MMALNLQCLLFRGFSRRVCSSPIYIFGHENTLAAGRCRYEGFKRLLSTKPHSSPPVTVNPSTPSVDKKNLFVTIYRMPYVRYLSVVNKLKVQQTILALTATPITSILAYNGYLPAGSGWTVGAIGFIICSFLYMLGFFGTNVIGFIYVTTDNSTVRISYVDGWGHRVDDEFPADDLIPLSELPRSYIAPLYHKLQRYSHRRRGGLYKLNISEAAQITDQDRFTNLFGKIEL